MKKNIKQFLTVFILASFIFLFNFARVPISAAQDYTQEIEQIQKEINDYQSYLKKLEEQKKVYEKNIEIKRKEAVNLKNQLSILKNQVSKTKVEIEEKETEITTTDLSIKNIQFKILEKQKEIQDQKENLQQILRLINRYDNKNLLTIIVLSDSISDILSHVRYLNTFQGSLAHSLEQIKLIKEGMELQEKDLRTNLQNITNLQNDLLDKKSQLLTEKSANENILEKTQGAEWKFQSLLADAVAEQRRTENEISNLETSIRTKLAEEEKNKNQIMEPEGSIVFSWPVPSNGITCSFHDPDYPYRKWIGEHPAVDIRASQGTNIRASASGYVAKAKNGGMGYSYIMIINNDTFSTVYGHVSQILVEQDEYVRRGTVIGKSGGLPGTSGAGNFSTGPHLHFEIRKNGIPVNPEDYLL